MCIDTVGFPQFTPEHAQQIRVSTKLLWPLQGDISDADTPRSPLIDLAMKKENMIVWRLEVQDNGPGSNLLALVARLMLMLLNSSSVRPS